MNIPSDAKKQKVVLIGNNARETIKFIPTQYEVVDVYKYRVILPYPIEVVKRIMKEYSDAVLFVVDIDYKCQLLEQETTPYPGILLLKYLRLHSYHSHFCLIGSDIEGVLKERPGDFIVTSKGVSVIEPENIACLSKTDFVERIIREKSNRLYTKIYFKHEDDFVRNRHYYSNIWGVLQLYKVHREIESYGCESSNTQRPSHPFSEVRKIPELQQPLTFFDSYQGLVMRLLYEVNDYTIQQGLNQLDIAVKYQEIVNKTLEELEEIAIQKESELAKLEFSKQKIDDFYQQTKLDGLIAKIRSFFGGEDKKVLSFIQRELQDIEHLQDLISHIRAKIDTLKSLKSRQDEILNVLNLSNIDQESNGYIKTIKALRNAAPSVLLIDDKAIEGGWGYIFQLMIYGERSDKFHIYQPNKNESIEDIANGIKNIITNNSIDVILLDIRLKDERGYIEDIDNVSGIALLERLKKDWLSIPIIVTTASKQKMYHTSCMQNRAIYFWTKPGIEDANWSGRELVLNYYSLIRTINIIITNPIINFIYKDFIPLMKEFTRSAKEYRFALEHQVKEESLFGMSKEIFKEVEPIIYTSFEIMIEKLQFSLQTDKEYVDFSRRNMALVLFLLSFCFERKVKSVYKGNFESYDEKIGLFSMLLNTVHNDPQAHTYTIGEEKKIPEHLFRFNLIRNNNTHESFSNIDNLRYYTLLFFNSLYCTPENIGKGVEFTLIKGRITKMDESYCYIVDTEDTDKKLTISKKQNSNEINKITDTKEYIFVLEKHIKLFNPQEDNPIFKVKSKGRVEGYPKKESLLYYIHDLNFHRNFFFSENYSKNYLKNSIQDNGVYDLHITYTILYSIEITNNDKQ